MHASQKHVRRSHAEPDRIPRNRHLDFVLAKLDASKFEVTLESHLFEKVAQFIRNFGRWVSRQRSVHQFLGVSEPSTILSQSCRASKKHRARRLRVQIVEKSIRRF